MRREHAKVKATRVPRASGRVVTVDAAQGSEADIVIISCVRCNPARTLGFITEASRMCVAFSRAREHLVILGSSQTLSANKTWAALHKQAEKCTSIDGIVE